MGIQPVSSSATLAHFNNSMVCLSHSTRSWVLDSGASDHVVGDPSLISNLSPPKIPHNITVANGSKAQVTGIGQASPLPSLSLNYVLFVPGSPFNLISISKLTQSLNCFYNIFFRLFPYTRPKYGKDNWNRILITGSLLSPFSSIHHLWCFCISIYHSSSFGSSKFG